MEKIKLNIDKAPLTSDEISKYKDFNALMNAKASSTKVNSMKKIYIVSGASVSIVTLSILIMVYMMKDNHQKIKVTPINKVETHSAIKPPIKSVDMPYEKYVVSNQRDTTIKLSTGTTISLQKQSLVEHESRKVAGQSTIIVREIKDKSSIFLSGIPMKYDSAGTNYDFESAGMVDIRAFSGNQPLDVAEGKNITIKMVSKTADHKFNVYYLDSTSGKWSYEGKDKVTTSGKTITKVVVKQCVESRNEEAIVEEIEIEMPAAPQKARNDKWHIKLDIVKDEFPELSSFENTLFEIDETYKPLDKNDSKITWEDVKLERAPKDFTYFITFANGGKSCKYQVKPVFAGKDLAKAQTLYENKLKEYQNTLKEKTQREQALKEKREKEREAYQKMLDSAEKELYATNLNGAITRTFAINRFGVWNCDYPYYVTSNGIIVKMLFKYNNESVKSLVYIPEIGQNMLRTATNAQNINLNRNRPYVFFAVVDQNKIAYTKIAEYTELSIRRNSSTVNLQLYNKTIANKNDFDEFCKLMKIY